MCVCICSIGCTLFVSNVAHFAMITQTGKQYHSSVTRMCLLTAVCTKPYEDHKWRTIGERCARRIACCTAHVVNGRRRRRRWLKRNFMEQRHMHGTRARASMLTNVYTRHARTRIIKVRNVSTFMAHTRTYRHSRVYTCSVHQCTGIIHKYCDRPNVTRTPPLSGI